MLPFTVQAMMRPPAKTQLANRLLNDPRQVSRPIPVARSVAPTTFFKQVRPVHAVIARGPVWSLGQGNGLGGVPFRGFGALGADALVEGVSFNHVWSMEDLTGSSQRAQNWLSEVSGGPRGLEYPPYDYGFRPIAPSTLASARTAWKLLADAAAAGNAAAQNSIASFTATLQNAARTVDATWDGVRFGIASRAPDIESQRTGALKTIVTTLNAIVQQGQVVRAAQDAAEAQRNANFNAQAQTAANAVANARAQAAAGTGSPGINPLFIFGGIAAVGALVYFVRR